MNFEKYYAERDYINIQRKIKKNEYSEEEKIQIMKCIINFIESKDYTIYHDFMDDIAKNQLDWFNMLTFDKKKKHVVLEYIKSRVERKYNKSTDIE